MDVGDELEWLKDEFEKLPDTEPKRRGIGVEVIGIRNLSAIVASVSQAEAGADMAEAANEQARATEKLKFWTKVLAVGTLLLGAVSAGRLALDAGWI